jgi:hypothetical protein
MADRLGRNPQLAAESYLSIAGPQHMVHYVYFPTALEETGVVTPFVVDTTVDAVCGR